MKAHKFVAVHGIEKAKAVLEGAPKWATNFNTQVGYTKASTGGEYTVYKNQRTGNDEYSLHHEIGLDLEELKQVVESVNMIAKYGGLFCLKCQIERGGYDFEWYGENGEFGFTDLNVLEKAIADYELIYCVADMGDDSHIENHVSPHCKVGVK